MSQPGPADRPRRRGYLGLAFGALGVLILLFLTGVKPYTDFLWYLHDAKHPEVFTLAYSTKGTLFAVAFTLTVALYYFSFSRALGVTMVYFRTPQTVGEAVIANAIAWIQKHGVTVVKIASVVLAFLAALGFSGEWNTWLLSRRGEAFGQKDPTFGTDLGYFVFDLPWQTALANYAFSALLLALLGTFGIYFGLEFLATMGKVEVSKPFVRMHLSVLGAGLALAYAARLWLGRYEIGYIPNALFTGGGYVDQLKLNIQAGLAIALVPLAALLIWNGRAGKEWRVAVWGGGIWGGLFVLAMWVFPAVIQRLQVEGDKINKESPFAERAMKMTRFGYGLDSIVEKDTGVAGAPSSADVSLAKPTLDNMRLWDPEVLRESIEPIQSLRPYYRFHDVDVDRYTIDGKQTLVMLSPRDVDLDGLTPGARSWVNMRLQYTHGYGVVMTKVNEATPEGRPVFLIKDFPPQTPPGMTIDRPQIYFSDLREGGEPTDPYAVVGTQVQEFDYPSETDAVYNKWTEPRGVPVGGLLTRLAYAVVNADQNILWSSNITSGSRILYRRNVIERARHILPFLKFDLDPYIVLFKGRLVWILDAYVVTDRVPYSAFEGERTGRLNYIRNAVKVTIDAYSGELHAYAMQPDDPLLKTYRKIYPKLIDDRTKVPEGLEAHFRYPEGMFMLQAGQLTQYHVKSPTSFLNNDDAWDLPVERGRMGGSVTMQAYYVQLQLPEDPKDRFLLILPMTPRTKGNMSGWLAAHCDPDKFGKLVLYRYPKNSNTPGPAQMESRFNQDQEIANLNKLLNSEQSELVQGNLLVVPIGKSVIYVKPLFLKSRSQGITPIPELRKVVLATSSRIVVADTYEAALSRLLGASAPAPTEPVTPSTSPANPGTAKDISKEAVREALNLMNQADQALRSGDFAKYGELQKRLKAKLEGLVR